MEYIFGFVILSFVAFFIGKRLFPKAITLTEIAIGVAIQLVVVAVMYYGSIYHTGQDVQILNGSVLSKEKDRVSCEHSYSCNCRKTCSGSGKSRSCSQTCDTCYEHSFDYDWVVKSDVGTTTIDRIDRQGTNEPPRWSAVRIGEPFARQASYFNYIKASPLTIFDKRSLNSTIPVPGYIGVHDYYRVNRVVLFDSEYSGDFGKINEGLNASLTRLGPKKKVNIVVVFHNKGANFHEILKAKHLGGKINDVYVLIDADKSGNIRSASAFSWSKSDIVNVKLRDDILDLAKVDEEKLVSVIDKNIDEFYNHRPIQEFSYLESNVQLPMWSVILISIFGIVFPLAWCYIAHQHIEI